MEMLMLDRFDAPSERPNENGAGAPLFSCRGRILDCCGALLRSNSMTQAHAFIFQQWSHAVLMVSYGARKRSL